jgi:hypothetical protein
MKIASVRLCCLRRRQWRTEWRHAPRDAALHDEVIRTGRAKELDKRSLDKRCVPPSGKARLAGTIISIRRYTRHATLKARCV